MKKMLVPLMLTLSLAHAAYSAEFQAPPFNQRVELSYRRSLLASVLMAPKPSTAWVVYLSGSSAKFHVADVESRNELIGEVLGEKVNYLIINKPGVSPEAIDYRSFDRSFLRHRRVSDILSALKVVIPPGDAIFLVGYSEGAYLAPEIAVHDDRVKGIAMIAGGTRAWLTEELNKASDENRSSIEKKVAEIRTSVNSNKEWDGFTYATWRSYDVDPRDFLNWMKIPILTIHGDQDDLVDLKTTMRDLDDLRLSHPNLISHVLKQTGHGFENRWGDVRAHLEEFLRRQIGRCSDSL